MRMQWVPGAVYGVVLLAGLYYAFAGLGSADPLRITGFVASIGALFVLDAVERRHPGLWVLIAESALFFVVVALPAAKLAEAVRLAHAGVTQLDDAAAHHVAAALSSHPAPSRADALTERETDVLRLIASGATNREIATRLHLSEGTVKNHISRILGRLGLRDRTQAAIYAKDHGLLS